MSFMIWGLWIEISLRWKLEKSPSVTPMVFPCFNCSIIAFFPGGFCHGRWCWVHCIGHSRGSGGSALARFRIADWQDFSGFPWFSENTELIWSRIIIIYYHILSKINPKCSACLLFFSCFFHQKWFLLSEACGGGVMGGLVGLVPAVFTFGLSIPIGAMVVVFRKMEGINVRFS